MSYFPGTRRWLVRAVLLLLLVVLAVWAGWDYLGTRELARLIRQARAASEPLTVLEAERQLGLDEDQGGAPLYLAAAALVHLDWKGFRSAADRLQTLAEQSPVAQVVALSSEPAEAMIEANALGLEMADRAAQLPFRAFAPGTDYSYRWQQLHEVGRIAALRSGVLALAGNDRASASLSSQIRQLRVFWGEGALDETAVAEGLGDAAKSLSWLLERSPPSDGDLARLDAALASLDDDRVLVRGLLILRAAALEAWLRYLCELPPSVGEGLEVRMPGLGVWFARPYIRDQVNERLRMFREVLQIASLRPGNRMFEALNRIKAGNRKSRFLPHSNRDVVMLTTLRARSFFEAQSLGRVARAAISVERFRKTNGGLPASLEQLRLADGSPLPPDPMTGAPLRLTADGANYVIYSIGSDGKDDGGSVFGQAAASSWAKPRPATDWGIRIRLSQGSK